MREIQISFSTEGKRSISQPLCIPFGSCLLVSQLVPPSQPALPANEHACTFRLSTACAESCWVGMIEVAWEFVKGFEVRVSVVVLGRWSTGNRTHIHKQPCFPGSTAYSPSCSAFFQPLFIPNMPFLNSVNCGALFPENLAWIDW